jgi:hypothetical protein
MLRRTNMSSPVFADDQAERGCAPGEMWQAALKRR